MDINEPEDGVKNPSTLKSLEPLASEPAHVPSPRPTSSSSWQTSATVVLLLLILAWRYLPLIRELQRQPDPDLPPSIFRHLGQYSPYFAAAEYVSPPSHCSIHQVSILQRHGSRWPTRGAGKVIQQTLDKFRTVDFNQPYIHKDVYFLSDYHYTLGEEDLVPLGLQE